MISLFSKLTITCDFLDLTSKTIQIPCWRQKMHWTFHLTYDDTWENFCFQEVFNRMNGKKQNPATQTSSIFATLLGGQVEHSRRMNLSKSTYPFILRKRVFNRVRRIFSLFFYSVFRLVYLVKEKTSLMQVSLSEKTTVIIRSTTTSYLLLVTCFEWKI